MELQVGVHPGSEATTRTALYLSTLREKTKGYALTAERNWSGGVVPVTLLRAGQAVARGEAKVAPGKAYALGLFRYGPQLLVEVNDAPVLLYNDTQPLAGLDSLGLENRGASLYPDDISVTSSDVHDYTFETAPTDWAVQNGTWEIDQRDNQNLG